jgi:hypothetical protein
VQGLHAADHHHHGTIKPVAPSYGTGMRHVVVHLTCSRAHGAHAAACRAPFTTWLRLRFMCVQVLLLQCCAQHAGKCTCHDGTSFLLHADAAMAQ